MPGLHGAAPEAVPSVATAMGSLLPLLRPGCAHGKGFDPSPGPPQGLVLGPAQSLAHMCPWSTRG